jgi:hypothetical protein
MRVARFAVWALALFIAQAVAQVATGGNIVDVTHVPLALLGLGKVVALFLVAVQLGLSAWIAWETWREDIEARARLKR